MIDSATSHRTESIGDGNLDTVLIMPAIEEGLNEARQRLLVSIRNAGLTVYCLVVVDKNLAGFTRNANRALAMALDSADFLCLMNMDVVAIQHKWLVELLNAMRMNPTVGFVAPSMTCGTKPQSTGKPGMARGTKVVRHVNMSCTLIRGAMIRQVGFMDPRYTHYASDYAWQNVAREQGWKSMWVKHVWVSHAWTGEKISPWHEEDEDLYASEWTSYGKRIRKRVG